MKIAALNDCYKKGELPCWVALSNLQEEVAYNLGIVRALGRNLLEDMGRSDEAQSLSGILDLVEGWEEQLRAGIAECDRLTKESKGN